MKQNLWDQSFSYDAVSLCEATEVLNEARLSARNYPDSRTQQVFLFCTRSNTSPSRELEQQIDDHQEHKCQNLKN